MSFTFISNGPVSGPLNVVNASPDVDFNGVKFSYDIGLFFDPVIAPLPLKLPPPFSAGNP